MPLSSGSKLGYYEIVEPVGVGGMGSDGRHVVVRGTSADDVRVLSLLTASVR